VAITAILPTRSAARRIRLISELPQAEVEPAPLGVATDDGGDRSSGRRVRGPQSRRSPCDPSGKGVVQELGDTCRPLVA
ncbi:hypothetical protein, partial [Rhizobium leguminosarum]|uniref:hypothetical protein n=1 Tax=Rhizobium leguminosarum TaxID=384 RepID=UPI003F9DD2AB